MKRSRVVLLLCVPLLYGSYAEYLSAQRKFKLIEGERLQRGSRVTLTKSELNAYAQQEIAQSFPGGVRDARLELANGAATIVPPPTTSSTPACGRLVRM